MENEDLHQSYSSLQELYQKVLKEKQDALEETERATISFARHFDSEVTCLNTQILSLTEERDKALVEAEDLGIKLANTKYELNRLQREHIKLQLEQEKFIEKFERFRESSKKGEEEKFDLNEKGGIVTGEEKMDRMENKDENLNSEGQLNHVPRPPVKIKKSKVDEDYTVYEELGRGKFGVVKRVIKQSTQEEFAAKWVKVTSQTRDDVLKEIEIMGKLNHKRLVGLYDAYEVSRSFVLIMEYITGGELFERIANEESVTEKECAHYMRQLLEGLQYMHKMGIVHLDLKPENIVCVSKDTWDIKLIDFGLAKELKPGKTIKTMQGTPEFVAPEVINFEPVSLASDMWSVGVIAYILISGLSPFLGDDNNETLSYVTAAEYDFDDESFNEISHEAKDFIEKLLQKPPSKRKTAEECLKHEWIKKNRGSNKIKTDNLKKFLAKRRWQKSVNAVRAVRRLSSMSSLFNAKAKSKSVLKLDEPPGVKPIPLAETKRDFSKSMPSVFVAEGGQLNKRAMKILDSDTEASQSESGSMEQINTADVDDKDVLEGLFKENKEILDFLSSGLTNNGKNQTPTRTHEKLGGISEEKDNNDDVTAKPEFVDPLPSTHTVPKGTPVLMTCTVRGSPAPTVTWFRHDKALTYEDTDVTIEREGNECNLSIGQCEVQDEGSYSCMIQNEFGQATCNTKLDVQVSPDFVREMRDASVEERKRVQFNVEISGRPLPTVEWYHGDTLLQEDRWIKIRKGSTDNTCSLVIRSATAERRGVYKCVITNPLDSISCTARLHIEGYDDEEDNNEEEEVLEETSAKEVADEVDNHADDHPRVSLREDDINQYYDIKEEIGKGRFGVIYYAIHKATGRDYAVKYIKVRKSQRDQFQHEIDIMNHLRHRRYIRLYEAFEESRKLILVLELMRGGELLQRLSEKDYLTEHEIIRYVKQILEGVKDMHEKDVLHLDLKPQNIMFTTEESSNLKLIDFGLARKLNAEKDLKILFGTPEFVAPEIVNYEIITPATDMWSVGVVTYILLSGVSPFWSDDPDITLSNVTQAVWNMPEELFQGVSEDAKDFLTKLLVKDPSKRMKVEEAFQHPWIKAAKQEDTNTNRISTGRLRKYYAHQKGLISARVITSAGMKNEDERKRSEDEKTKTEVNTEVNTEVTNDNDNNNDSPSSLVSELTKERDDLKQQLDELLEKYNNMEDELRAVKTANKDQEQAFNKLKKRNKLLEDRNIANQEATQRLIRLECEKRDLEDKFQQKDKKFNDLSKKYENIREKAASYDSLEEKVLYLEKERKTSQTQCKKVEEQLRQLQEAHEALKSTDLVKGKSSIAEDDKSDVLEDNNGPQEDKNGSTRDSNEFKGEKQSKLSPNTFESDNELKNKVELMSKELEIAQAEIQRLNTTISSQHDDLEEMERVGEHKRKLETRCKGLEEQLVELEHEGTQREQEIDEMEEDIIDLQEKLEKSHKELRAVLEENKALKQGLESGKRTRGKIKDINGHSKMANGDEESSDVARKPKQEESERSEKTRDVTDQNGSNRVMNGDKGSPRVKPRKRSAEPLEERKTEYVTKPAVATNGSEISDDDVNDDTDPFEDDGEFSAKYYQLEKEIQELLSEKFGETAGRNEGESENANIKDPSSHVNETTSKISLPRNMDIKQLRQLSRKLMKANKSLIAVNEKLYKDKLQIERQNEQLRNEFGQKLQTLEKENETFKRLLKAEDKINAVDEILSKTTIEALKTELASQEAMSSDLRMVMNEEEKPSNIPERSQSENDVIQLEMKIKAMKNDKSLMVFRYENELEESHNFYVEEQQKLKTYYEERIASVEKQNQNLKSQINVLMSFNDNKKNNCEVHTKELNDLERLHQEELQEVERNLALTLSQQLHSLTNLSEQEKNAITKEKDAEINRLTENCRELNDVITSVQEQVGNYPEILEKCKDLERQLSEERGWCEALRKEVEQQQQEQHEQQQKQQEQQQQQQQQQGENCERLRSRVRELEHELVALRKLEEDNILLAGENEKLIEQLEIEKQKLDLMANNNLPDSESKLKLEELHNEKSPSKMKENSKKYLKKRVSQLESDCKDLWRKLQSEVLKSKQKELEINRETTEKERILQALHKAQISNTHEKETRQSKTSNVSLNNSNSEDETGSINEDKDNDYFLVKEKLKKAQSRTYLLQTEIDRLRESYSNNLSKELEDMENKWTQRLRRECNAVHSEMAEEFRKQKEAWRKKESELHCVIKELQIQIEETETDRKRLERELNALKAKGQNGRTVSERLVEAKSQDNNSSNNTNNTAPVEKEDNQIQDYISDRDLRRLAYKLKKDQWLRLAKLLSLSEAEIREIDQLKVGKDEKAFRVLSEWRTCAEEVAGNQVSQLALALEEIRRKDLAQFVMEHCMAGKIRNKLVGV